MKRISIILIVAMISLVSALKANAQNNGGPDAGGLWCYVDIDIKHDVTEGGWGYYELLSPVPNGDSISLQPGQEIFCMGPGRPKLVYRNGVTCLKIYLREIEDELMGEEYGTAYVEVNSDTLVSVLGWWTGIDYVPKYYTIQLQIKNTDW